MDEVCVVDSCPVPSGAAPLVVEAKHRSGETLESCFRGSEARAILARFGKHDQAYLWNGWVRHLPGFNPANPPGFSTHECFNDGPAFPSIRRGGRIPEVCVGQDWSNGAHVVQIYRAMGVNAALTYPGSVREKQHINIRQAPKNLKLPLKLWDKGKRVVALANHLMECEQPNGKRYLKLAGPQEQALRPRRRTGAQGVPARSPPRARWRLRADERTPARPGVRALEEGPRGQADAASRTAGRSRRSRTRPSRATR
jgi:hypothetical protein